MGQDGRMYAVKTLKNGYEITDPNGEKSYLVYNKKEKSWNYKDNGMPEGALPLQRRRHDPRHAARRQEDGRDAGPGRSLPASRSRTRECLFRSKIEQSALTRDRILG